LIVVLAFVVAAVAVEALLLTRVVRRLGGLQNVLLTPRPRLPAHGTAVVDRLIRRLPCSAVDAAGNSAGRGLKPPRDGVLVLVDARSVAARRVARLLGLLAESDRCPVPWTWCVGGGGSEVARFVREQRLFGSAVRVSRTRVKRGLATGVAIGIYVDRDGVARQIGPLSDRSSVAAFIGACPNSDLRRWLRQAAPRVLDESDSGKP
jgi:hypothetical protein